MSGEIEVVARDERAKKNKAESLVFKDFA